MYRFHDYSSLFSDFTDTLKVPEAVIEIKYYNPDDPNQPKPPTMTI
jgi:hypothetical protein